jgi:hypothetical protein
MNKQKEKLGNNTHQNFNVSPEIKAWSKRYNTPIAEIEQMFAASGNSIAKTLEKLRLKDQKL